MLDPVADGPVNHGVRVWTVPGFVRDRTAIETYPRVDIPDWLVAGDQSLLELTAGLVFHDGLGEVQGMQEYFRYYPRDLWLYRLAAQWKRIGQMEPFVGRTGEVGDDTGSALIAAGLVRDMMRLAFIIERVYAPYPKWFGTAFSRLRSAPALAPFLGAALAASTWQKRQSALIPALEVLAALQNGLGVTAPVATTAARFHDRPFRVINAEDIAQVITDAVEDDRVRALPPFAGSIDQLTDVTDILAYQEPRRRLRALYRS